MQTVAQRVAALAEHIRHGGTLAEFREKHGLSKGAAAHAMRTAKSLNLIEAGDYHWQRKAAATGAAKTRDQIADMAADGLTLGEIAGHFGLSIQRISFHWQRICRDLGWQAS